MSDHEPSTEAPSVQPTHTHAEKKHAAGPHPRVFAWPLFIALIAAAAIFGYRATSEGPPLTIAFVTADQTEYWDRVIDGAEAAAEEFGITLRVDQASGQLQDQNARLTALSSAAIDGLAVSPVDASRQANLLRDLGRNARIVTVDSDSPLSGRTCFIGADNYFSGRLCGEIVKEALPEGGNILIVTGPLDKANGRQRREGLIDELLGRERMPERELDPTDTPLTGTNFTIPMTVVDPLDPAAATQIVTEALQSGEKYDAVVGLYGYHAGSIAQAVEAAALENPPKVIGFDALPSTLDLVENGKVHAVIAQDQFNYGFHSVRVLVEDLRGKEFSLPLNQEINFPPLAVTADNLGYARQRLAASSTN